MEKSNYVLENTEELISPALVYYKDIILDNTKRIIEMAGGPQYLWPHVKSHKAAGMIDMQIGLGITRFKCATVAEAEVTAEAGAAQIRAGTLCPERSPLHIILAFPLVGPNIARYLRLAKAYPQTVFYAIGDDFECLSALAGEACQMGMNMNVLVDTDIGMHRTGVSLDALESLYERCALLKGITVKGLHCYDGHSRDQDLEQRRARLEENDRKVLQIQKSLVQKGLECGILVMGGTPSFPCRTGQEHFYLSPGTLFIGDWGYYAKFPDIAFTPGAAVFCRVVSHQTKNTFTLDLGHKGIAADPAGDRGIITGLEEAKPVFQSEEHWVFSLPPGKELPPIGSSQYVIPAHICPTSALYPELQVAQGGKIVGQWQVSARNRKITY
ncbi:MAG: D-TA family PLP-dependent enzyme [Treponema sp.]|nr:D-TA family PLP-dependent enzyme [Treponema sp.]